MANMHSRKSWWVVTEVDREVSGIRLDERVELARAGPG